MSEAALKAVHHIAQQLRENEVVRYHLGAHTQAFSLICDAMQMDLEVGEDALLPPFERAVCSDCSVRMPKFRMVDFCGKHLCPDCVKNRLHGMAELAENWLAKERCNGCLEFVPAIALADCGRAGLLCPKCAATLMKEVLQ